MTIQVYLVLLLTFVIYVIGTLGYATRVVGVKTGRIAVAFSVFNIFVLIQRTANTFQAPLLAKTIENQIHMGSEGSMLPIFRMILLATTIATIAGAFLLPSFVNVFEKIVLSFSVHRSMPRVIMKAISFKSFNTLRSCFVAPKKEWFEYFKYFKNMPKKIILLHIGAYSIQVVGVLSSLYAGYLSPEFRSTCNTLSSVINSSSTIIMFIFIDPFLSMLTDDVVKGSCRMQKFKGAVMFMVMDIIIGTVLAQFTLVPAAKIIVTIAQWL